MKKNLWFLYSLLLGVMTAFAACSDHDGDNGGDGPRTLVGTWRSDSYAEWYQTPGSSTKHDYKLEDFAMILKLGSDRKGKLTEEDGATRNFTWVYQSEFGKIYITKTGEDGDGQTSALDVDWVDDTTVITTQADESEYDNVIWYVRQTWKKIE